MASPAVKFLALLSAQGVEKLECPRCRCRGQTGGYTRSSRLLAWYAAFLFSSTSQLSRVSSVRVSNAAGTDLTPRGSEVSHLTWCLDKERFSAALLLCLISAKGTGEGLCVSGKLQESSMVPEGLKGSPGDA